MAVGSAVSALNRPGWIRKAQQVFTARFALAARRPVRRLPPSPGWTWRCALRKANGRKSLREYPRRSGVYAAPNGSATALPNLVLDRQWPIYVYFLVQLASTWRLGGAQRKRKAKSPFWAPV